RTLTLTALVSLFACADSSGPPIKTGTVSANITDAPFPIESVASVDVFILKVEAMTRDVSDAEISNPSAGGWRTIAVPNKSYNLMALRNGATAELGKAEVE